MKEKKGLQKFTDLTKIEELFKKNKIEVNDLLVLTTKEESEAFTEELNRRIRTFTKNDLDKLRRQVDSILTEESKNILWESNHLIIIQFIQTYVSEYGAMPNKTKIADGTNLSRVTIHKHFDEYSESTVFKEQSGQFKIMRDKVTAKILLYALQGDVKACRLFLEVTGGIVKDREVNAINNNYIQINNTILNAEVVNRLNENQLKQIERIITGQKVFKKLN